MVSEKKLQKKLDKRVRKLAKWANKSGVHYVSISAFGDGGYAAGVLEPRDGDGLTVKAQMFRKELGW